MALNAQWYNHYKEFEEELKAEHGRIGAIMSKKRLWLASDDDLKTYIHHGYNHFLFGIDQFSSSGCGKIDETTFMQMVETITSHGGDVLALANRLIHEDELDAFQSYLLKLQNMNGIEGIVVADHSALWLHQKHHWLKPLIYSPDTLMASTMDIEAALSLGYTNAVIANEIQYDDVIAILDQYSNHCMIQTFGYLKSSVSARYLLSDYMEEIGSTIAVNDRNDLYLVESTRHRKMPVVQTPYGTTIYTDYIRYNPQMEDAMDKAAEQWISTLFLDSTTVLNGLNHTVDIQDDRFDSVYWNHGSTIVKEGPWKR